MLCARRAEMIKLGKSVVQHSQTHVHAAAYHAFLLFLAADLVSWVHGWDWLET